MALCVSCEKQLDLDEDPCYFVAFGEQKDEPVCEGCYCDDIATPNAVVVRVTEGNRESWRVGSYNIESSEDGEGFFDWGPVDDKDPLTVYMLGLDWHRTDAWRGYFEGTVPEGWTRVINDWVGMDGYNLRDDLELFHDHWQTKQETPAFDMIVGFPRGSNVCVQNIEVLVPSDKVGDWESWITGVPKMDPVVEAVVDDVIDKCNGVREEVE
jgi:hypothetical protein